MSELMLRRLGLFFLIILSVSAQAEIMKPLLPSRSIGLGFATLHVEQPDRSKEQRYRWDLHQYSKMAYGFRLHNRLGIARDTRPGADSIAVNHHFHELYSGLQWTGTRLFRYGIGAGPLLLLEQTITRIHLDPGTERSNNRLQLGGAVEAQLDYAISDAWEVALYAALQFRPAVDKQDLSFGVSLQFNWGGSGQDEENKSRLPAEKDAP